MTYILRATRIPTMSERQARRVDDLVDRYHGWNYFTSFGAPISPDYLQDEDGTHTEIEILVADKNCNFAESEFRACGFVVSARRIETVTAPLRRKLGIEADAS
jgi:hypothetical protein